jgi:hypothetical protein
VYSIVVGGLSIPEQFQDGECQEWFWIYLVLDRYRNGFATIRQFESTEDDIPAYITTRYWALNRIIGAAANDWWE